jgi:hypothetical protein
MTLARRLNAGKGGSFARGGAFQQDLLTTTPDRHYPAGGRRGASPHPPPRHRPAQGDASAAAWTNPEDRPSYAPSELLTKLAWLGLTQAREEVIEKEKPGPPAEQVPTQDR